MTDFFISYTGVDRFWAEWIAWQLEAAGYTTVIQAWDFRPGANFALAMQHAAAESERTIAVLSPAYLQSGFTAAEWAAAFAKDPTGRQGLLLPVRIQDCELRGLLPQIVYIDLVGLEAEAARERLLAGVLRQRTKPTRAPVFPGHSPHSVTAPPLFPGAIPQNIPLNLAQVGSASKFSSKLEEFFEEYLITETGLPTVPFGGRDADVALLDAWLDDATAPPRYLLTAPAGRGKSALLVRWLQHLREQGRVGRDAPAPWQLVFVPISIRFETHRPDIFYEAIASRFAEILGQELPPTPTDKGLYYADHCRTLASTAVAEGRRILIVLDGIDEALGEQFDARWFPRNPGASLRLVLSARWQAGDLDSLGWKTRLTWERGVRVQSRELPVLAREGVQDLLIKMGAPIDVLAARPDIVDRLHILSEGEPLVLRYYAEDIWSRGEAAPHLTIDDLRQIQPGLGAYFARWLNDQERLWRGTDNSIDRRRVDMLLAILACAHGRLTGTALRALLTERGEAVEDSRFLAQLKPIRRFVIGLERPEAETAGYILSHPKLGIYLREEHFDPEYIQATQTAFVRWGRKTAEGLNDGVLRPECTPAYLLQYHTQHLQDAAAPAEAFLELVEQGWLRAWETFEGGYRGFSRDVYLAYKALSRAHAIDQHRFAQRLRCQLVLGSIHSISANTPWQFLVAACKKGILTYRQAAYWLEFKPSSQREVALSELVPHLPGEVLFEVLTTARAIANSAARARILGELAPSLPGALGAEVLTEALTTARAIADSEARARILGELMPWSPGALGEVEHFAQQRQDLIRRAWPLLHHIVAEVLTEVLTSVRAIEPNEARARVLGRLALRLPGALGAEVLTEALMETRAIADTEARVRVLGELAPQLSGNLLQEGFEKLLDVLPKCRRDVSLFAVSSFFPFLEECQGPKGLDEVRHAIIDTARWFP